MNDPIALFIAVSAIYGWCVGAARLYEWVVVRHEQRRRHRHVARRLANAIAKFDVA